MKSLSILLIDDDEIERMKFRKVCEKNQFPHIISEAINGEKGIHTLNSPKTTFDIIILDLNMPRMDGKEFLKMIKLDENLKSIPIIIMSTSNNHNDLNECCKLGVSGYFTKPLDFTDYSTKIVSILNYWGENELIS